MGNVGLDLKTVPLILLQSLTLKPIWFLVESVRCIYEFQAHRGPNVHTCKYIQYSYKCRVILWDFLYNGPWCLVWVSNIMRPGIGYSLRSTPDSPVDKQTFQFQLLSPFCSFSITASIKQFIHPIGSMGLVYVPIIYH